MSKKKSPQPPRFTEADVQQSVGEASFSKGRSYYSGGAVSDTVRRGAQIEALCQGTRSQPYRVTIAFVNKKASGVCSCPVGYNCKHVAAVLMAWAKQPGDFVERGEAGEALEQLDKPALIALIEQMIEREPELESLIDLQLAVASGDEAVDPAPFQRQMRAAMRDSYDWDSRFDAASEISRIVKIGDGYAERGQWTAAQVVYRAVIEAGLEDYQGDDEGEIIGAIGEAVPGLVRCFEAASEDRPARREILKVMFESVKWDVDFGGIDFAHEAHEALLESTTPAEREQIRKWILEAVPETAGNDFSTNWRRETWARWLKSLALKDGDAEGFLRLARQEGWHDTLFHTLVDLKRLAEAEQVARDHLTEPYPRYQAIVALDQAGWRDQALSLAEDSLNEKADARLVEWAAKRFEKVGQPERGLKMHLGRFKAHASFEVYQDIRRAARKLKQWETLRATLMAEISGDQYRSLRIQIHLDEQEWDEAWEAARAAPGRMGWGGYGDTMLQTVAQALEKPRPELALQAYLRLAEQSIEGRSRGAYATAAEFLKKARTLFDKGGRKNEWPDYVAALRARYPTLRALQDELKKAGL